MNDNFNYLEPVNQVEKKIIDLLKIYPTISKDKKVAEIGVSRATVIRTIQLSNMIVHVESVKGGHWIIKE